MLMKRISMISLILALWGAAVLTGCPGSGGTAANGGPGNSATLSWSAPTTQADGATPLAELLGYRVHYGTVSRSYTTTIDVGNVTDYVVNNLSPGTYYFAVTAYNSSGDSDYSMEGSKTIP